MSEHRIFNPGSSLVRVMEPKTKTRKQRVALVVRKAEPPDTPANSKD